MVTNYLQVDSSRTALTLDRALPYLFDGTVSTETGNHHRSGSFKRPGTAAIERDLNTMNRKPLQARRYQNLEAAKIREVLHDKRCPVWELSKIGSCRFLERLLGALRANYFQKYQVSVAARGHVHEINNWQCHWQLLGNAVF
ncbi:hypothetical protein J6590_078351 [Homalodisca vitripennis]|nr:hypothetical protein J6590_078351 [Homalodisca vitripennis]